MENSDMQLVKGMYSYAANPYTVLMRFIGCTKARRPVTNSLNAKELRGTLYICGGLIVN